MPSFMKTVSERARREFYDIFRMSFLTKEQREEAIMAWAAKYKVEARHVICSQGHVMLFVYSTKGTLSEACRKREERPPNEQWVKTRLFVSWNREKEREKATKREKKECFIGY